MQGGWHGRGQQARKIPEKRLNVTQAKAQLSVLLIGCTDERLGGFTAEQLARQYRVKEAECAAALQQERDRRASRALPL